MIDAHTHLDACGCVDRDDVVAAMDRAAAVGVNRVVTVADDLASARWVAAAVDWHPDLYARGRAAPHQGRHARRGGPPGTRAELAAHPRVVAIGETGLDHYWDAAPQPVQAEAFAWHIDLAKRLGKPLMIHDRDAHDDVLAILQSEGPPDTVIFHCFSGGPADGANLRRRGLSPLVRRPGELPQRPGAGGGGPGSCRTGS